MRRPLPAYPYRTSRSRADEDGAAALEFALVMPILFLTMFGILQYGLYFNDSFNTRQGVREGARMGVVANFGECGGASTGMDKLRCTTKKQINVLAGRAYVKVVKPATWEKAQPLIVCAMVETDADFGILPMPNDGWIASSTQMSIEQDDEPENVGNTTADPLPSGMSYPC